MIAKQSSNPVGRKGLKPLAQFLHYVIFYLTKKFYTIPQVESLFPVENNIRGILNL